MPLPVWWGIFYFMLVFISMVTSGDSNISAMSSLSTKGITYENEEAPYQIKIIWGLIIGLTAWIMITLAGLDGVRMTSNLGGFPALIILVLILSGTIKLLVKGRKSELFENQYD
jgi:glycine betaine transporter